MEKIYDFLRPLYDHVEGHIWGIAGGLLGLIEIGVAMVLHSITEPITIFSHFVSNLGIGPNGSAEFWNTFSFLCALILIPFMPYLTKTLLLDPTTKRAKLSNFIVKTAFWISMMSGLGLMILSAFSMAPKTIEIHAIGAGMFFIGDLIFMFLYTVVMYLNGKRQLILYITEGLIALFFIGMLIAMLDVALTAEMNIFSLSTDQMMEFLSNMSSEFRWIRFFEWLVTITMLIWFVIVGYISRKWEKKV